MLNQSINVLWTLASFVVVGSYWGDYLAENGSLWSLYTIIVISIVAYSIPDQWLSAIALSNKPQTYERIGIRIVLWLVQDGKLVSRIERAWSSKSRSNISFKRVAAHLKTIAIAERFHCSCFVFFGLSTVSALSMGKVSAALFITLWNILYNVYPILLQQYIRLRINNIIAHRLSSESS
jgi:hypothetical protein